MTKYQGRLLKDIDDELTSWIRANQDEVLGIIEHQKGYDYEYTFQMFNGDFGGKNNTYVDSVRMTFPDFRDFYGKWLSGLIKDYNDKCRFEPQPHHNAICMQNEQVQEYVKTFLQRNFYRNLRARTREKPNDELWEIWFGYQLVYGILISPRYNLAENNWEIDKSEIRRVEYKYWTIGHLFEEGFVDPESSNRIQISSIYEFRVFYQSVLKKLSNSKYEQEIFERYLEYLSESTNLNEEPLLIPEMRYEGYKGKHLHRLDFTIMNPHTFEFRGFELSPASSHMSVAKLKEKQILVNAELSKKWNKEMKKRNDYFEKYNIPTITFTDAMLSDMDSCWSEIKEFLEKRPIELFGVNDQIQLLNRLGNTI